MDYYLSVANQSMEINIERDREEQRCRERIECNLH
jgi:hypothetical protein